MRRGLVLLVLVLAAGTTGYSMLGLSLVDAAYQTVTTVSTVGFRELGEVTTAWKLFTMVIVLAGASTVLYNVGAFFEAVLEGHVSDQWGKRRMQRDIAALQDHVIVCGCGRVGQTIATYLDNAGQAVVVIDLDETRLRALGQAHVQGDATDDAVLYAAGISRASTLIAPPRPTPPTST